MHNLNKIVNQSNENIKWKRLLFKLSEIDKPFIVYLPYYLFLFQDLVVDQKYYYQQGLCTLKR